MSNLKYSARPLSGSAIEYYCCISSKIQCCLVLVWSTFRHLRNEFMYLMEKCHFWELCVLKSYYKKLINKVITNFWTTSLSVCSSKSNMPTTPQPILPWHYHRSQKCSSNICMIQIIDYQGILCVFPFPCRRVVTDAGRGNPAGQMAAFPSWPKLAQNIKEEPQEDQKQPWLSPGEEGDAGAGSWPRLWLRRDSPL